MRKVRLDNLRDYRPPGGDGRKRRCDHPGCDGAGEYRAPKSRRALRDYFWFCLPHVQAYNKAWNYHAGMSAEEIERHIEASVIGERPLWPLGQRGNEAWRQRLHAYARLGATFRMFDEDGPGGGTRAETLGRAATIEGRALATLGLTAPSDLATIKKQYKLLVKRYHPDANGGGDPAAEEHLKRINEAYAILKKQVAS